MVLLVVVVCSLKSFVFLAYSFSSFLLARYFSHFLLPVFSLFFSLFFLDWLKQNKGNNAGEDYDQQFLLKLYDRISAERLKLLGMFVRKERRG